MTPVPAPVRAAAVAMASWAVLAAVLPSGLPLGVVLLGVVLGSLSGLTSMGLVLVHRSSRIVNFAQAEMGALAASVAVVMVVGFGLPYFAALPVGLAAAFATGAVVDLVVVRRFFTAPRLILTVATIGVAQVIAGVEVALPRVAGHIDPLTTFRTPFDAAITVGPITFTGDHVVAAVAVPIVLAALAWFMTRSDAGVAIRAAAESSERALLLGVPVRRLSTLAWTIAAGLSGVAAMLTAPMLGPTLGALAGPELLLAPLAAAVVARMESLVVALLASLAIGVAQQAVLWSWPRSSAVDLGLFGLVLAALLLQRRREARVDDDLGTHVAVREVRPVPGVLARLPEVRLVRLFGALALVAFVIGVPAALSPAQKGLVAFMAIYGIIAVSLVVLTGWAGQVSLGQFAFVGLGAATTGGLLAHSRTDLFVALLLSAAAGAASAVLIGLPALRIRGLLLAVTTLAFAVPVSTFVLNSAYLPDFTPPNVERPAVLERFDLDAPLTFAYFCMAALAVACILARNFRRTRVGRASIAVRDNERAAAAFSISPVRAKLTAFAFSGALAGFAGGLYVLGVHGIGFAGFAPVKSLEVFTMVVVGGLASLPGALLGAVYVQGVTYFFSGAAQLLATGAGLLVLLMVVPGGLGEVVYAARDAALRWAAARRRLDVPGFTRAAAAAGSEVGAQRVEERRAPRPLRAPEDPAAVFACKGVSAAYGKLQVLSDVDLDAGRGEVVALLGTNGAGKSTLLRVAAGVLPARGGRVVLDGEDVTGLDPVARLRRGLVTVPGGRGVFGSLTVAENLRVAGWLRRDDRATLARDVESVVELFPVLRARGADRASTLSGGEQQMLTLAQAMLCRPRVLLVDELSLGLAPTVVARLLDVVCELAGSGVAVVLVEQSLNVATSVSSRAVFMEKGAVRFAGPTAHLLDDGDVARAVFLGAGAPRRRGRRPAPALTSGVPALEIHGVRRNFGGVAALDGVDLAVGAGAIVGIIGPNGAGKTTLFDVCSGFVTPDAGRVRLAGVDVTARAAADRAEHGLGRSFQDARLFPSMTVAEALAVACERHVDVREPLACVLHLRATAESEADVRRRVDALVERTGLGPFRDRFVAELSTGTRRVLDLACAMAHDPSVLLLDEPSSGLAQREAEAMGDLLRRVRDETGAALVVIEHDIPLVSALADELVCLHLGSVLARGRPADVLADPAVVACYLGTDDAAIARSGRRRTRPRAAAAAAVTTA